MRALLIKNIHTLVTMDDTRRELRDAAIFARGPAIEQIGTTDVLPSSADEVLDLHGRFLVMPALAAAETAPSELIYALNDRPPLRLSVFVAVQHVLATRVIAAGPYATVGAPDKR